MNKMIIGMILVIIVLLICVGYYLMSNYEENMPELSNNTRLLDYSNVPVTNWNEKTHEYKCQLGRVGVGERRP